MVVRGFNAGLFVVATLLVGLVGVTPHAWANPVPGRHSNLPIPGGQPEWTYDLYIPPQHASKPDDKFATFYIFENEGDRTMQEMIPWAEKRGVILVHCNVGINKNTTKADMQAMTVGMARSVQSSTRAHPLLNFVVGKQYGGIAAAEGAAALGRATAGLIVMIMHRDIFTEVHRGAYVAILVGHFEPPEEVAGMEEASIQYKKRGNTVMYRKRDPVDNKITPEVLAGVCDWMYWNTRLYHSGFSKAEREAAQVELDQIVTDYLASIEQGVHPKVIVPQSKAILALPTVAESERAKPIIKAWFNACYLLASRLEDELDKHTALTAIEQDPLFEKTEPDDQKVLNTQLKKMRSKSPLKEEWAAQQEYEKVKELEDRNNGNLAGYPYLIKKYTAVARKYAETFSGGAAAGAANRLTREAMEASNRGKQR